MKKIERKYYYIIMFIASSYRNLQEFASLTIADILKPIKSDVYIVRNYYLKSLHITRKIIQY